MIKIATGIKNKPPDVANILNFVFKAFLAAEKESCAKFGV